MLPRILLESQLSTFKFWFNSRVQDGLHYQHDLYYRAKIVEPERRSHLYQVACRLAEHNAAVVMTAGGGQYSLWISLRNQKSAATALRLAVEKPVSNLLADSLDVTPLSNPVS